MSASFANKYFFHRFFATIHVSSLTRATPEEGQAAKREKNKKTKTDV